LQHLLRYPPLLGDIESTIVFDEENAGATHKYSLCQFADVIGIVVDKGRAAWA
jgi:hypothetical protein